MKTYYFKGKIILDSPLHIGSGEADDYVDSLIVRDVDGKPFIPGTSLCGLMASIAKDRLRLEGADKKKVEEEPVLKALFGSARGERGGRESRLIVLDAKLSEEAEDRSLIRDRTSVDRKRNSAARDHLFHDEILSKKAQFDYTCEFRKRGKIGEEKSLSERGLGANREALHLLLDVLELIEKGWARIGGKTGTGHGYFHLEGLTCFYFERSDPDDVLSFALDGLERLAEKNPVDLKKLREKLGRKELCIKSDPPEVLIIRGILRPVEPIIVKAGYSIETAEYRGSQRLAEEGRSLIPCQEIEKTIPVDATFCKDEDEIPYLPGSALRGCLRSQVEDILRTLIYRRFKDDDICLEAVWDLENLKNKGRELSKKRDFEAIESQACIVSKLFGFTALGGKIRFKDAYPLDSEKFKQRIKLLDHVAIDRFTGGAAEGKKFNSRPFFPKNPPDDSGDLQFQLELVDFKLWHLGLVALLLKDLQLGKIRIGYGRTKGLGKVKLLSETVEIEALTCERGILKKLLPESPKSIGGFLYIPPEKVKPGKNFWLSKDDRFYPIVKKAVEAFRKEINSWRPPERRSQ